jgi:hypothetical protein
VRREEVTVCATLLSGKIEHKVVASPGRASNTAHDGSAAHREVCSIHRETQRRGLGLSQGGCGARGFRCDKGVSTRMRWLLSK